MRRRMFLIAALAATLATPLAQAAPTPSQSRPPIVYSEFEQRPAPQWQEPNAPIGSVAYSEWLGHMFNGVLFNTRDPSEQRRIAERIIDVDYIQHNRLVQHGRAGILQFMPHLFQAMPDAQFIVHDVIATNDRVITRWTWRGTITGDGFLGVTPKGQRIEFDGIDIWTVRNGRLYEHWDQFDWPRAFVQLGITDLPAPFFDVARQPYSR